MRYLFIDRDGTLIEEPADTEQIDRYERLRLMPAVISALKLAQRLGFRLVMVTNQDGLGTPAFPEETFWGPQRLLMHIFESEGITWDGVHIDRSPAANPSPFRKPSPLMILPYLAQADRARSLVIGDRITDVEMAYRAGLRALYMPNPRQGVLPSHLEPITHRVNGWPDIMALLPRMVFSTAYARRTRETDIQLTLTLYGTGQTDIQTGVGFLDHMLTLLAYHAGWDLRLHAQGDLEVDAHHTVEDVAIALGEALRGLLGDAAGLHRYGQWRLESTRRYLPMDETLALVVVDYSGRGHCEWRVALPEGVGGISPALWKHFFQTLAVRAGLTLHLWANGEEAHHLVEALFKGLGRALRESFQRDWFQTTIPSTKGRL